MATLNLIIASNDLSDQRLVKVATFSGSASQIMSAILTLRAETSWKTLAKIIVVRHEEFLGLICVTKKSLQKASTKTMTDFNHAIHSASTMVEIWCLVSEKDLSSLAVM